jgi:hypothetical protein
LPRIGPIRRAMVRVTEVTDANGAVETFANDIDETVAIARLHVKALMSPRQVDEGTLNAFVGQMLKRFRLANDPRQALGSATT